MAQNIAERISTAVAEDQYRRKNERFGTLFLHTATLYFLSDVEKWHICFLFI